MNLKEAVFRTIDSTTPGHHMLDTRRAMRASAEQQRIVDCDYQFENRSTGADKLCIVLAGYKEDLWDVVFDRLAEFLPDDIDVCIMTSGLVNDELRAIAKRQNWSYLSTSINHLSHIQNLAIKLHPQAEWIYKIDEDMFITAGFFETLLDTWHEVEEYGFYQPAFVSPLINVNCYGHLRLLDKLDLLDDFRRTGLSEMKFSDGLWGNQSVLNDPEVAKYLWGDTQPVLRDLDALTARFSTEPLTYSICPLRYSIGSILFSRANWEDFDGFPVTFVGSPFGLGDDEEHIGRYAFFRSKAIVVNENVVVGHLGYGPQSKVMTEYFKMHEERFALPKDMA